MLIWAAFWKASRGRWHWEASCLGRWLLSCRHPSHFLGARAAQVCSHLWVGPGRGWTCLRLGLRGFCHASDFLSPAQHAPPQAAHPPLCLLLRDGAGLSPPPCLGSVLLSVAPVQLAPGIFPLGPPSRPPHLS